MKRIIVDANLLVLLIVGLTEPSYIAGHKRLSRYDIGAFELLKDFLGNYPEIVLLPHILAEVSNLVRNFAEPGRAQLMARLRRLVASQHETYIPSASACQHESYQRLGLTDAAILTSQDEQLPLLTDDLDLYVASLAAGRQAVNFAHLRDL